MYVLCFLTVTLVLGGLYLGHYNYVEVPKKKNRSTVYEREEEYFYLDGELEAPYTRF